MTSSLVTGNQKQFISQMVHMQRISYKLES